MSGTDPIQLSNAIHDIKAGVNIKESLAIIRNALADGSLCFDGKVFESSPLSAEGTHEGHTNPYTCGASNGTGLIKQKRMPRKEGF